ncbi:hypothetical protein CYMTET_37892 [Cymbomonas tetramitiformis]|uniref:Uncharacterized protein n=1 Tax=Cymbomonas tetramitiformis TaxID=36881 RepID=A0AAE0CEJ5_9CHLO|nr:hypothetical protein CYMTET_37892 [Cymbomonas tetramitiformis]
MKGTVVLVDGLRKSKKGTSYKINIRKRLLGSTVQLPEAGKWLELPFHVAGGAKNRHEFALGIKAQDDPRNNDEEDQLADYSKLVMAHNLSKEIGVGPLR